MPGTGCDWLSFRPRPPQVLLRFRPHESHLDIPGGPVAQYGDLARDLQLQAFPQFVSGAAFFGRQAAAPVRVQFTRRALCMIDGWSQL